MGKQPKVLAMEFAPTAAVTVAQLDKVDRTVILRAPAARQDSPHPRIDMYKGTRPEEREQRIDSSPICP